jgi:GT2 family glycosyltransferase
VLWTVIHCPAVFYLQGNFAYLTTWNNFASDYLERMQVLWSDLVVSPSAFMLKWVQQHGWTLPAHVFVQHNLLSNEILHWARNGLPGAASGGGGGSIVGPAAPLPEVIQVEEFVFFARLEVLKGIYEFCDAIDLLTPDVLAGKLRRFDVTFLGNPNMGDTDAVKFIQGRARGDRSKPGWAITPKIYTDRIQPEAIEYMRGRLGRVSVLASLVENSPYTVLESLTLGIPFIASNVGGIPELIRPEDRTRVLFTPNARSLAERMRAVLVDGLRPARGTSDPFRVREEWLDFHRLVSVGLHQVPRSALSAVTAPLPRSAELSPITAHPLVSVVVVTHDRGDLLLKTLESLMAQTYTHFEVLLVDDGSTQPRHVEVLSLVERFFSTAQPEVPFRLVRQANLYPGAARNHGARLARGEYVMFLDDDDLAKPTWMSTMVSVALRTGADVVTCMADFFHGEGTPVPGQTPDLRWIPVGPAVDLGLYHNVFGAYSALVRRASFFAIGGFTEDFGTTYEDYEFFATAVLKGFQLELVPEPLLWYRQNPNTHLMKSTNRFLNRLRSLRAYEKAVNPLLRQLIAMVYGTGMDAGE